MKAVHSYCALIDILGYRNRLAEDLGAGGATFQADMEFALRCFDEINSAVFGVQAISDTVIMTCTTHDRLVEFLEVLRKVFIAFLERGLFIRGAVAYSRHFQSARLTYSHAIARAYELESSLALYPRILIDENIVEMHSTPESRVSLKNQRLLAELNGRHFLNVLTPETWQAVYASAKCTYLRDSANLLGDEAAFGKHLWFERYLSAFAAACGASFAPYMPQPLPY